MNDAPHLLAARGGFQYFKDTVFLSLFGPFGCKGKAMGLYFVNDVISGAFGVSISGKKVSAVKLRLPDCGLWWYSGAKSQKRTGYVSRPVC